MHFFAGVTVLVFGLVIALDVSFADRMSADGSIMSTPPMHAMLRAAIGIVGAIAAVSLWFSMVAYYFKGRPDRHRLLWGVALFVGVIAGALAYFWVVWRRENRPEDRANAA